MSDERNWWRRPAVGGELSVSPSEPVGHVHTYLFAYLPVRNTAERRATRCCQGCCQGSIGEV